MSTLTNKHLYPKYFHHKTNANSEWTRVDVGMFLECQIDGILSTHLNHLVSEHSE